jgi:hypothetical protein
MKKVALNKVTKTTKSQTFLATFVQQLLPPGTTVYTSYKHPDMRFTSKVPVELDIFVPSFKLAFEYQGQQHYQPTDGSMMQVTVPEVQQQLDKQKLWLCKSHGITLIAIPYWWDRTLASLAATVHMHRPDLVSSEQAIAIGGGVLIASSPPQIDVLHNSVT